MALQWWVDGEGEGGMSASATATVSRAAPRAAVENVVYYFVIVYCACPMRCRLLLLFLKLLLT